MKILLLGEFSGFHTNLKEGLLELGADVCIVGTGDGSKKIEMDVDLSTSSTIPGLSTLRRYQKAINFSLRADDFDVLQMINPSIFPRKLGLNDLLIKYLIGKSKKSYLSACGDDSIFVSKGCNELRYSPIPDALKYDLKRATHTYDNRSDYQWNIELANIVSGVIPVMHEYDVGYTKIGLKTRKIIPLPVNINKHSYSENKVNKKIRIFHGLNRYGFKGTRHVEEAFDILNKKYPNDLEVVIEGNLPLNEYLEVLRESNIIIDQTNGYSCGMNALYSLAQGKVLLGGAEPESLQIYDRPISPVLNITPNAESIVRQVEYLLENRKMIPELGYKGRKFVEENHSHIDIAQRYLAEWSL